MITPTAQRLDYIYQISDKLLGDGKLFSSAYYFNGNPPWLVRPRVWNDFDENNVVVVPAVGSSVDIVVFDVPVGQDGVLEGFSVQYQASDRNLGDLVYRMWTTDRPVKNYEAIQTDLGSVEIPRQVRLRIYSGTRIKITCEHVANAALTDKGLVGTLKGYTYSKSEV